MIDRKYIFVFKIVITTLFLSIILYYIDFKLLIQQLERVNSNFFFGAIITFVIGIMINTLRLYLLSNVEKKEMSYSRLLKINFIGLFFSIFLPGRTAGDLIRGYYLAKLTGQIESTVSTILMWRIIGLMNMLFIASISSIISYSLLKNPFIIVIIIGLSFLFLISLFVLSNTRIYNNEEKQFKDNKNTISTLKEFVRKVVRCLINYKKEKGLVLVNIVIAFISNLFIIATWFLIAKSINANIAVIIFLLFIPMVSILQAIPISFNGIGLREASAILLFGSIGIQMDVVLTISLLFSGLSILVALIGSIIYIFYKQENGIIA